MNALVVKASALSNPIGLGWMSSCEYRRNFCKLIALAMVNNWENGIESLSQHFYDVPPFVSSGVLVLVRDHWAIKGVFFTTY
jgi:hypothetical protein